MEEYSYRSRSTDGRRRVERRRHGEAIGDVVREIGAKMSVEYHSHGRFPYMRLRYPPSFTLALISFSVA